MKQWNEIKSEFETDGSLRDIYVENVQVELWNLFIEEVKNYKHRIEFSHGDNELALPNNFNAIKKLQETDPTTLRIWLPGDIQLNCHFFTEDEIELDVSPCDVQSEASYLQLLEFLKWLSSSTKKEVKLTHEGSKELIILGVET